MLIVQWILSMLAIAGTWAIYAAALVGVGLLCRMRIDGWGSAAMALWLGWAVVIAGLQLAHFVMPIHGGLAVLMIVLGGVGLIVHRKQWLTLRMDRRGVMLLMMVLLWMANRAAGPGVAHDSGLYHYHTMGWFQAFPIVPGLGNLHIRLGFNHAFLLWAALVDTGPWQGRGEHLASGFVLAMLGLMAAWAMRRIAGGARHPAMILAAGCAAPVMLAALGNDVSSPRTDFPTAAVILVGAWTLLRDDAPWSLRLALAGLMPAMKLSAAGFGLGMVMLAGIAGRRSHGPAARCRFVMLLIPLIWVGPWLARGMVLSGHPMFPSSIGAIEVGWRVPESLAAAERDNIRQFSRLGNAQLAMGVLGSRLPLRTDPGALEGGRWLPAWIVGTAFTGPIHVLAPLALGILGLVGGGWRIGRLALPGLLGAGVWFLAAPEPRFGVGVMWALGLMLWAGATPHRSRTLLVIGSLLIATIVWSAGVQMVLRKRMPWETIPLILPGPDHGMHPHPQAGFESWSTNWGLSLEVPIGDYTVWRGPLRSTGFPHPDLRLRTPDHPADGFEIVRHPTAPEHEIRLPRGVTPPALP